MPLRPNALSSGFIAPCLPTSAPQPPSGAIWLHEIKHDGFRVLARKNDKRVKLYSRPGNDLTYRFPLIVEALAKLRSRSCIIDGEAVACSEDGIACFDHIRHRRHDGRVFLYAFDLIELDGEDMRRDPLATSEGVKGGSNWSTPQGTPPHWWPQKLTPPRHPPRIIKVPSPEAIGDPHLSFRDPFVFFLHSNIDRLWAMWQRQPGHPERLDPATAYGSESNSTGSGDVEFGEPKWGILSPLEPWAGLNAQNAQTGTVTNLWAIRPWFAPENEQNLPGNNKNSRDPSVVTPPSYDTVPHSAYIIHEVDTFSDSQVQNQASYPGALLLIYDGFTLNELGGNPPPPPTLKLTLDNIGGADASPYVTIAAEPALTEGGGPDTPQRITFPLDIAFIDPSIFNSFVDTRFVALQATHGAVVTDAAFELTKQPNPYMLDGNPYWLSTDVRVFKLLPNGKTPGSTTALPDPTVDPNAPLTYINARMARRRARPPPCQTRRSIRMRR